MTKILHVVSRKPLIKEILCCFILVEQTLKESVCLRDSLNIELKLIYPLYHIEFNLNQQIFTKFYCGQSSIALIPGKNELLGLKVVLQAAF